MPFEQKYSDEDILNALRTHPDLSKGGWQRAKLKPYSQTISRHFGSWNRARLSAGLTVHFPPPTYSDEKILEALRKHPEYSARKWSEMEIRPYMTTIIRHFGSLNRARIAADLKPRKRGRQGPSEEERRKIVLKAMKEGDR